MPRKHFKNLKTKISILDEVNIYSAYSIVWEIESKRAFKIEIGESWPDR